MKTNDAGLKAALDFGVELLLQFLLLRLVDKFSVASVFRRPHLAQDVGFDVSTQITNAAHVVPILTRQSILRHHIVLITSLDGKKHLLIKILF